MISWDSEEVARFLGVQPQQPHGEDTEFIFAFESGDHQVQLAVQPYNTAQSTGDQTCAGTHAKRSMTPAKRCTARIALR